MLIVRFSYPFEHKLSAVRATKKQIKLKKCASKSSRTKNAMLVFCDKNFKPTIRA